MRNSLTTRSPALSQWQELQDGTKPVIMVGMGSCRRAAGPRSAPGDKRRTKRRTPVAKRREVIQQVSEASKLGHYYETGSWHCSLAPNGAHHWIIDGSGRGQCKYCGEMRQFTTSGTAGYSELWEAGESRQCDTVVLEETVRELLHIA